MRFLVSAFLAVVFSVVLGLSASPAVQAADSPIVAAASDLRFALEEIAASFTSETGQGVSLIFGSSGNFAKQIEQGAPYQLFLSADERYVFALADKNLTRDRGTLYAIGRIVLIAPAASTLANDLSANGLREAIAVGKVGRFAIPNPEDAPYGRAARQWLEQHKLWEAIKPMLVLGDNASQAAQFVASGNTDGGILPYSLVINPKVASLGKYQLLPDTEHEPLRQRMVLLKNADATVARFYLYMQDTAAREIMRRYGFVLP